MGTAAPGHRLFGQAALYTLALVLLRAGNFLLVPIYTVLLTTADYGRVNVMQQIVNLLATVAVCGLPTAVLRMEVDLDGDAASARRLRSTLLRFTGAAGLAVTALALATWPLWGLKLGGVDLWPLGLAAIVGVGGQALFVVALSFRQVAGRAREHTGLSLSRWGVMVGLALLLVLGLRWGAAGILLALSLSFWFGTWRGWRGEAAGAFDRGLLRRALAYGLPIVPHALAGAAFMTTDRALLGAHRGMHEAGVYALGVNLASAVFMVAQGTQSAWVPFFMREDRDRAAGGWERVRRLSFFSMLGVACVAVGIGLLAPEMIALLAPDAYLPAADVVPRLALANFVRAWYLVGVAVVLAEPRTARWLALATVPAAALNVALNAWWIPSHGADGAVASALVSYAVSAVCAAALSRQARAVPFKFVRGLLLLVLVAAVLEAGRGAGLATRLGLGTAFAIGAYLLDARDLTRSLRPILGRLGERMGWRS